MMHPEFAIMAGNIRAEGIGALLQCVHGIVNRVGIVCYDVELPFAILLHWSASVGHVHDLGCRHAWVIHGN